VQKLTACSAIPALLLAVFFTPLFHVHTHPEDAATIHEHLPELEAAEDESVVVRTAIVGCTFSRDVYLVADVRSRGWKGELPASRDDSIYSLGVKPFQTNPLSFAVVAANTREAYRYQGSSTRFEDPLISARYRVDAPGLAKALGVQESYVMGVGGLEVPLGNKDHAAGHRPFGEIAAGLFSIEKRPLAGIAYAYYHHPGEYNNGMLAQVDGANVPVTRQNGNFFTGTGIAYTPIDDDAAGHLFSMQLGLSYEKTLAMQEFGKQVANTAASAVMMHPGLVFQTNPRFQFFALVSLPLTQQAESLDYNQRFRLDFGTIIMLGHSGKPQVKQ
jgi:hypothetical protein